MKEYAHEFAENVFYTPSDLSKQGGLWIIRSGANRAKPNYRVGPRMIKYYSVHFVVDGAVEVKYADRSVTLGKGDLFCLFPEHTYEYGTPGQAGPEPSRELQMIWLSFDGPQAAALVESVGLSPSSPFGKNLAAGETERTLREFLQLSRLAPNAELLLLSLAYKLFAGLQARRNRPPERSTGWLEDCVRYIRLHYAENISVDQIARHFGLHRSYLSAAFAKHTGQSPMQYLTCLRLHKGAQMLEETSLSITEIALSVGYPDLYAFSRAFARRYGLSPSEYRKQRG